MPNSSENSPWSHPFPQNQDWGVPSRGDVIAAGAPQGPSVLEGFTPLVDPSKHASSIAGPDELMSDVPPQSSSATTMVDGTAFHPPAEDAPTEHSPLDLRVDSGQQGPTPGPEECPSAERLPNCHAAMLAGIGEHVCVSVPGPGALQLPGSPMSEDHGSPAPDDDHFPSAPSPAETTISLVVHPRTPPWYQIEGAETHDLAPLVNERGPEMEIEVERRVGRREVKKYRRDKTQKYLQQKSRRPRRPGDKKTVFDRNSYSASLTTLHPWSPCGSGDETEGLGGPN